MVVVTSFDLVDVVEKTSQALVKEQKTVLKFEVTLKFYLQVLKLLLMTS